MKTESTKPAPTLSAQRTRCAHKLSGEPSAKGVYVKNGRKVVVK